MSRCRPSVQKPCCFSPESVRLGRWPLRLFPGSPCRPRGKETISKQWAAEALIPAVQAVKFLSAHADRNGTKNREEHHVDLFALMELGGR